MFSEKIINNKQNRYLLKSYSSALMILVIFCLCIFVGCDNGKEPIVDNTGINIDELEGTYMKNYHISPKKGWLNDPNGLIYFDGLYHCFYQYYPRLPAGRDKFWGHAVSKDLLHWKELSPAILPDTSADSNGIWSGSSIEKDGIMYSYYTGLRNTGIGTPHYVDGHGQFGICLATSQDGIKFTKHATNPLIPLYPEDGDPTFRDPSVSYYNGVYYMMLAAKNSLLYKSVDLINWEYVGVPYDTGAIECPDFRPFKEKYLYIFSQGNLPKVNTTVKFAYGDFDGKNFHPLITGGPELGPHFYAPQTMKDSKGRTLLLAWMYAFVDGVPVGNGTQTDALVNGALTIPREIFLKDGKICSYPPEEYWSLLTDSDPDVIVTGTTVQLNVTFNNKPLIYTADSIQDVKIFRENNSIEVFINGGEAVFTYLY